MNAQSHIRATISSAIVVMLLFVFVNTVYAVVILDSFVPWACGNSYLIRNVHWGTSSAQAQSWNQGLYDKAKVTSIKVKASKYGSPTGYLYCRIASHIGVYGTSSKPSSDLETSTNSKSIATISSNDARPTIITFTFAGSTEILKDTAYTFYVYAASGSLDGSNYVKIWGDVSHDGNRAYPSATVGYWVASSGTDLWFYVYGEEVPTAEWHEITTWNFNLTTNQWLSISTWNLNLTTMQWQQINLWSLTLISAGWHSITQWMLTFGKPWYIPMLYVGVIITLCALALAGGTAKRRS